MVKVMIVDDNAQVRRMIRSFLSDLVDEFTECADGDSVLPMYREHLPDLVLIDGELRPTDGFKATRDLRTEFPNARVMIVSQWDSGATRKCGQLAGAEGFFNKNDLAPLRELIKSECER